MSLETRDQAEKTLFATFLTRDGKFLNVSYAGGDIDSYNDRFESFQKTHEVYDSVEFLYLETDTINALPNNIKKFKKLTKLEVSGSRFWDLKMKQVPSTVKELILVEQTNLSPKCIKGAIGLINLERLELDLSPFKLRLCSCCNYDDDDDDDIDSNLVIPCLPNLKVLQFESGDYCEALNPHWKDYIMNHNLFRDIKSKIQKIDHVEGVKLVIEL